MVWYKIGHSTCLSVHGDVMVHISEVVREIMKSIVIVDHVGAFDSTLFNTLQLKMYL